ncbi:hypothetical protein [Roseovarius sp. MMSF_3281]|uniref:hypothetical protein n=1 Tax=Roseovarius sp. MMSF_3281 TaxID=3046694 RepID=UPI00273F2932|nr:hypothetical protein [Roseovarius sp. MMSF_3281]
MGGQISRVAGARMIGVTMGYEGPVNGPPWVDEKITGGAVNALGLEFQNHDPRIELCARHASPLHWPDLRLSCG